MIYTPVIYASLINSGRRHLPHNLYNVGGSVGNNRGPKVFMEDEVKVMIEESEAGQHVLLGGLNSGLTNTPTCSFEARCSEQAERHNGRREQTYVTAA